MSGTERDTIYIERLPKSHAKCFVKGATVAPKYRIYAGNDFSRERERDTSHARV